MLVLTLFLGGCTDDFEPLNTPQDELIADNLGTNLLGQAFSQAQYRGVYGLHWQHQISQALFSDLYAQYFATTAANFDSDQYVEVGRWIDLAWGAFYEDAAPQLDLVLNKTAEEGLELEHAVAQVWKVQMYHQITDYWGPAMYSEFGNGEKVVPYDSQQEIYNDFFSTLEEAVGVLEQHRGENAFGSNDLMYGGNVNQWIRFANSLRLRLAMRVRYVNSSLAQDQAEAAVSGGVIESNQDIAEVKTTSNNRNPYFTITNWGEFRMSSAMESSLEGFDDPRIETYFSPAAGGDSDGDGSSYEGMRNGLPRQNKVPALNENHSDMGISWLPGGKGGTNANISVMRAAEVFFLRAEGALQGWNMGGTAEDLYNQGIRASLNEERFDVSSDEIDAYVNSSNTPEPPQDQWNTPAMSDIPVAFESGASQERQLEQIITQKWLALYPDSWEAYAEHRRTGYPRLYSIIKSLNPDVAKDETMRRMTYVSSEFSTNSEAVNNAIDMLDGPDQNDTRLWWDAKPLSEYPERK